MEHAAFVPAPLWVIPFIALLLCIAVLPLVAPHVWESNGRKLAVSVLLGAPVVWLYARDSLPTLIHASHDYISFIVLLGSLFVISSGVRVDGDLQATPATNTTLLGIGALAASFVGTTGASMLLIRPLLDTNSERQHVVHTVVFFIFLVSNIGGCLTPLGDQPARGPSCPASTDRRRPGEPGAARGHRRYGCVRPGALAGAADARARGLVDVADAREGA